MENKSHWFKDWFNSHYYHLLYQHRNHAEAEAFIMQLLQHLKLNEEAKVLDLACGKGRHSVFLNQHQLDVIGIDLSSESISAAKQFENEKLRFHVSDMRDFKIDTHFDVVFNLFTSFGYFKTEDENKAVLKNIHKHLKDEGLVVIDYLNSKKITNQLPQKETIQREVLTFKVEKYVENDFIIKKINFQVDSKTHEFYEYVRIIELAQFDKYFKDCGLKLVDTFGDYDLNPFDADQSDRLILIGKRA